MNNFTKLINGALLASVLLLTHCGGDNSGTGASQTITGNAGGTTIGIAGTGAVTSQVGAGGTVTTQGMNSTMGSGSAGRVVTGAGGSTNGTGGPNKNTGKAGSSGSQNTAPGDEQADQSGDGTWPAVTDYEQTGLFTATSETTGPAGYVLFYPKELGKNGIKHPIVSWGPGAVENAGIFTTLLNHLASHGFAVISYDATPQGQELITGLEWMLAENDKADSVFYKKLDTSKIAVGGHSAGSLATFVVGGDKRITTTMHISGGTFDPHTDINNLHAPALMICGEAGGDGLLAGDLANPNCQIDFDNAKVPVFYGVTKGAAHMTPTEVGDAAIRVHQLGAMAGWLRWQLTGDQSQKKTFVGDACTLCSDPAWSSVKQKNW
jgi:hypothetical protein